MNVKIKRAALVLVAAVVVTMAGPTTMASAATSNCAAGYTCIWRDNDYKTATANGTLVRLYMRIPDLRNFQYSVSNGTGAGSGYGANDSATSVYNRGNIETARYYKGISGSDGSFSLPPGSGRNNLSTSVAPIGFNDTISSIYFTSWDPNI